MRPSKCRRVALAVLVVSSGLLHLLRLDVCELDCASLWKKISVHVLRIKRRNNQRVVYYRNKEGFNAAIYLKRQASEFDES